MRRNRFNIANNFIVLSNFLCRTSAIYLEIYERRGKFVLTFKDEVVIYCYIVS